jgi:hypothetical protein
MLDQLAALSFDAGRVQRSGNLLLLDAHETLAELMMEGAPDAAGFIDVTSSRREGMYMEAIVRFASMPNWWASFARTVITKQRRALKCCGIDWPQRMASKGAEEGEDSRARLGPVSAPGSL